MRRPILFPSLQTPSQSRKTLPLSPTPTTAPLTLLMMMMPTPTPTPIPSLLAPLAPLLPLLLQLILKLTPRKRAPQHAQKAMIAIFISSVMARQTASDGTHKATLAVGGGVGVVVWGVGILGLGEVLGLLLGWILVAVATVVLAWGTAGKVELVSVFFGRGFLILSWGVD